MAGKQAKTARRRVVNTVITSVLEGNMSLLGADETV